MGDAGQALTVEQRAIAALCRLTQAPGDRPDLALLERVLYGLRAI